MKEALIGAARPFEHVQHASELGQTTIAGIFTAFVFVLKAAKERVEREKLALLAAAFGLLLQLVAELGVTCFKLVSVALAEGGKLAFRHGVSSLSFRWRCSNTNEALFS